MPRCTNKGCQKDYEDENEECNYHSGAPVFHEGLKSWSCCKEKNKPVLDFESFMKIPGCTKGKHTSIKPKEPSLQTATLPAGPGPSASDATSTPTTHDISSSFSKVSVSPETKETHSAAGGSLQSLAALPSSPPLEDEDDATVSVKPGSKCLRQGCGKSFVSEELSRTGDGEEATCVYHPAPPIFHEGSKGYLCCKKRVLDFNDFLNIEGCKSGTHVFVKKIKPGVVEDKVKCRIDHYQTPTTVHVSVFAKKVVKDQSIVRLEDEQIYLDLVLPDNKRFEKTLALFGAIDPVASTFTYFGTKVELTLKKSSATSWNFLEKPSGDVVLPQGYNITFGVSGRTGSVGAKTPVLAKENQPPVNSSEESA